MLHGLRNVVRDQIAVPSHPSPRRLGNQFGCGRAKRGRARDRVSFDALLFEFLRAEAEELEVDWHVVQQADGAEPSSQDWKNLLHLVSSAQPKMEESLLNCERHLLLVHAGLIARYDMMSILETLRDRTGQDVPCPGAWVLVATDQQSDMPLLDHAEIPLISPGQRAIVSEPWIDNLHRGRRIHDNHEIHEIH